MAKKETKEEVIVDVEEVYSKSEKFFEDNQKTIYIALGVIVGIVAAVVGWNRFYIAPMEQEAQSQMFMAEKYFELDSFRLALEGDGNYLGFLEIADDYGMSKSGNLANYYAGICYLHVGSYEDAIEYLNDFDADDNMISQIAEGAIGDAHMELGEYGEALSQYLEAANDEPNEFRTPIYLMKAGLAAEKDGNYKKAKEIYQRVEKEYPETIEGRNVAKYIARAEAMLAK